MGTLDIIDNIGTPVDGYVLNTFLLDPSNEIDQEALRNVLGMVPSVDEHGWIAPVESLHITLFDLVSPLVDYGQQKSHLFDSLWQASGPEVIRVFERAMTFVIRFSTLHCTSGVVWLEGADTGEINHLRRKLRSVVAVPDETKAPPSIIHATLARGLSNTKVRFVRLRRSG